MTDWQRKGKVVNIEVMKAIRSWKPFIFSIVATPFALLAGLFSAGAGHGNYFVAKIVFPYTILSTIFFHSITIPFLLLAIAQFPLYGIVLSFFSGKRFPIFILALIHLSMVMLCLLLVGEDFS